MRCHVTVVAAASRSLPQKNLSFPPFPLSLSLFSASEVGERQFGDSGAVGGGD
uniref:Uncharacterized protein n=1 Tax=Arundo donax TaxID=35708 RepID=A0A0A8XWP7_ARUDO